MIELGEVHLRPLEERDVDRLLVYRNDPAVMAGLGGFSTGFTRKDLLAWLDRHRGRADEVLWAIASAKDDACVGHVGLYQIDARARRADFGILIGDAAYRSRGVGRLVTRAVVDYGFRSLNLNRIHLTVLATNAPAVRLYDGLGFRREGVFREHEYRAGRAVDVIEMAVLASEWDRPTRLPSAEIGSTFALATEHGAFGVGAPLPPDARLYATATGALHALARAIVARRGARPRLHVPRFFHDETIAALARSFDVLRYEDDPSAPQPDFDTILAASGDVVLAMNHFGARDPAPWRRYRARAPEVVLVDDVSHDPFGPWALHSSADYAVASLRKTLPVPDGAILWSPRGLPVPDPTGTPLSAAALRLEAMALKRAYLAGATVAKDRYRSLEADSEAGFARDDGAPASAYTVGVLPALDVAGYRRRREANVAALLAALPADGPAQPLFSRWPDGACPFSVVLVLGDEVTRDAVRRALVEADVYAAVHWRPAAGEPDSPSNSLKSRVLTLPADQRYGPADMARVAAVLATALRGRHSPRPGGA